MEKDFKLSFVSTEEELLDVIDLGVAEGRETGLDVDSANMIKVYTAFRLCIDTGFITIAKNKEGRIIGALSVLASDYWWRDGQYLQSIMFYVDPEYRSKSVGSELLNMGKYMAMSNNIELVVPVESVKYSKGLDKLFENNGFQNTGAVFKIKER